MAATIEISLPDDLVNALGGTPAELPRRTLEAVVIQSYRAGLFSHAQVGGALGFDRWQTDALRKDSEGYRPGEPKDFGADLDSLRRIAKQ